MQTLVLLSELEGLNQTLLQRLKKIIKRDSFILGYIPSQTDSERKYFRKNKEFFSSIGVSDFLYFDVDEEYNDYLLDKLLTCDGIYLSGGNTFSFLHSLKKHDIIKTIRRMAELGKPVIGCSAGAILMADSINIAEFIDVNTIGMEELSSLGLIPFEFMPHWDDQQSRFEQIEQYSKASGNKVYACFDGDGILVIDGVVEKFGDILEIGGKEKL
jgi:dipeptidase E